MCRQNKGGPCHRAFSVALPDVVVRQFERHLSVLSYVVLLVRPWRCQLKPRVFSLHEARVVFFFFEVVQGRVDVAQCIKLALRETYTFCRNFETRPLVLVVRPSPFLDSVPFEILAPVRFSLHITVTLTCKARFCAFPLAHSSAGP